MLSSTDASTVNNGKLIYMAGLGVQEACFTGFLALAILFWHRMKKQGNRRQSNWHHLLFVIYAEYILITIRVIFRIVEYSGGYDGPIPHNEGLFYALDPLMMVAAIGMFSVYHPGRVLVGPESEFVKLTKAEKREMKQLEKQEKLNKKNGYAPVTPSEHIYRVDETHRYTQV
jgi:hypothetical protein